MNFKGFSVKNSKKQKKKTREESGKENKGITLIALVITVIVLLILAGITINSIFGSDSVLNKATQAKEENAHATVKDQINLELVNYELAKGTGEADGTVIKYLADEEYFTEAYNVETSSYVINYSKINGVSLGKGTSKETGDVYVIEKESIAVGKNNEELTNIEKVASVQKSDVTSEITVAEKSTESDNWTLRYYYKTSENKEAKELLNFTSKGNITGEYWGEIKTVGELIASNRIKVGEYVNYEELIGEQRSFNTWNCDRGQNEIETKELKTENLKWRVLSIDEENGNLTLISDKPTYATFEVPDNKDDEEVVQKLNEACNSLYGAKGIECRNLDYNDILNGYEDDENIKDIIIGIGPSADNVYYEECGKGGYYAMLITDVENEKFDEKMKSIYQNGVKKFDDKRMPELYNEGFYLVGGGFGIRTFLCLFTNETCCNFN